MNPPNSHHLSHLHVKKSSQRHRPAPLTRKTTGQLSSPMASPRLPKTPRDKDRPETAVSFLNYCATCEKQINVPNNSILYCSEACRRKDSTKPLSMSSSAMDAPLAQSPLNEPDSPRAVIPPLTPSGLSNASNTSLRIPADLHNAKSDLDPTEWKPKLHRPGLMSQKSANSAAFHYLSQFHRSTSNCGLGEDGATVTSSGLGLAHRSSASIASMNTAPPSLAASPDTAASDDDSASSRPQSYAYGYGEYDFTTRPLTLRRDPSASVCTSVSRGFDLVTPHCAPQQPAVATSVPDHPFHGGLWEKVVVDKTPPAEANQGLGALFGKSEDTGK